MKKLVLIGMFLSLTANAQNSDRPKRACDEYIQKYCQGSSDHGPRCLKGHESDVSAACLSDMQRKGPAGPPPEESAQ